ncbi:hypothetical protein [Musicola paradisiaca]|uniref:hypothetical protein n=1 Tax=Musicola paradisiaca TaxID=69223 RepID=UPI00030C4A24|nr:hypothetical protein [Musicola paradisiaca]
MNKAPVGAHLLPDTVLFSAETRQPVCPKHGILVILVNLFGFVFGYLSYLV